jgi:uncharacterized protein (DUF488 family)
MIDYSRKLYTIGHSNHKIEYFIELLRFASINCVIDVRSTPASKFNPQYNLEALKSSLAKVDVVYMHFGDAFGARHRNPELWDDTGVVDFNKVQRSRAFQDGIERVDIGLSKGFNIALMCSEGNPLECHIFSMISSYLVDDGFEVEHIIKNKTLLSHEQLMNRLEKKYAKKIEQPSLFQAENESLPVKDQINHIHNKEIGWSYRLQQKIR